MNLAPSLLNLEYQLDSGRMDRMYRVLEIFSDLWEKNQVETRHSKHRLIADILFANFGEKVSVLLKKNALKPEYQRKLVTKHLYEVGVIFTLFLFS